MLAKKLRVLARGTARVPDYGALIGTLTNRFHGWKADRDIGMPFVDVDSKQPMRHLVHVKQLGEAVEIATNDPHYGEYVRHLRDRDLWPADEFTAMTAGVPFDPSFGDEHGDEAKRVQSDDITEIKAAHGVAEK